MEKAWEIDFSCGMAGCDKDTFLTEIMPGMTKNELIFILNESSDVYETLLDEYKKRYAHG